MIRIISIILWKMFWKKKRKDKMLKGKAGKKEHDANWWYSAKTAKKMGEILWQGQKKTLSGLLGKIYLQGKWKYCCKNSSIKRWSKNRVRITGYENDWCQKKLSLTFLVKRRGGEGVGQKIFAYNKVVGIRLCGGCGPPLLLGRRSSYWNDYKNEIKHRLFFWIFNRLLSYLNQDFLKQMKSLFMICTTAMSSEDPAFDWL